MLDFLTSERFETPSSMRVLSVSGGGLLGVVPAAMLIRMEDLGRSEYGPDYRLADSFDLVGGTSTGAVIATGVALGMSARSIADFYLKDVPRGFRRRRTAVPLLHDIYDGDLLQSCFHKRTRDRCLRRADLSCHLAITVKDLTGEMPMVFSTLEGAENRSDMVDAVHRRDVLPLDLLLRASTAAPGLFSPVVLKLNDGTEIVAGDGGVSPFNDPGLLLARLAWDAGAEKINLTSLGTGYRQPAHRSETILRSPAILRALRSLLGVIRDSEEQTHRLLSNLASVPSAPLEYRKVNMELEKAELDALGVKATKKNLKKMRSISSFSGKTTLFEAAQRYAAANINEPLPLAKRLACGIGV